MFRPYYQLSEEERMLREERERRRVERLTQEMRAKGRLSAPYNTTQFLLSDHGDMDENFERVLENMNQEEDNDYFSGPSDEEEFINKEFNKDYAQQQFDNLLMMNKDRLMDEYLEVAKKNEVLETKLEHLEEEEEELESMRREMAILKAQNMKLQRSNCNMKERIRMLSESQDSRTEMDQQQ